VCVIIHWVSELLFLSFSCLEYQTSEKIVALTWLGALTNPNQQQEQQKQEQQQEQGQRSLEQSAHCFEDSLLVVTAHYTVNILTLKEPLSVAYSPTGDVGYFIGRNIYDGYHRLRFFCFCLFVCLYFFYVNQFCDSPTFVDL
jgi:hypothetical protein